MKNSNQLSSKKQNSLSVLSEQQNVLGKKFAVYGTIEEPLFLAKDVAEWIEHSDVSTMLRSVDDDEKVTNIVCTLGGNQKSWFLTENGVYEVLMLSRKPVAKDFKREVKKILHSIRTTGGYTIPKSFSEALQLCANQAKALEEAAPKLAVYDNFVERNKLTNFRDMAAKLGMKQSEFMTILKAKYIYKTTNGEYRAYADYQQYFAIRTFPKGVDKTGEQLMLTLEGASFFLERYGNNKAVEAIADKIMGSV